MWQEIKTNWLSFSFQDWMVLAGVASIFIGQTGCAVVLMGILVLGLIRKELISSVRAMPGAFCLFGFIVLEVIVSSVYENMTGLINACGMLLVMGFMCLYRQMLHPKLFSFCIELMLVGSLLVGVYALFQFQVFSAQGGYSFLEFHIQNSPKRRIMATFDNANLYATLLEFWIFLCIYQFVRIKKWKVQIWHVFVGLFNFGLLLLTGCRTALLPFVIIVPLFFALGKEKKWLVFSLAALVAGLILVVLHPSLIPRITDMSTLESRFEIWACAWAGIVHYPYFGMGPQSYHLYYQMFDGHKAPHAHNIYIDSLASYGIIGTLIILVYALRYLLPEICRLRLYREDPYLFGLVIGFILIFLIHGLLDVTINVLSTGVVFFMVVYSGAMMRKPLEKR